MVETLSDKRQEILVYISECLAERGYPPSVREIGEAVGLASSSTVHAHLAVLQTRGVPQTGPDQAACDRGAVRPGLEGCASDRARSARSH